MAEVLHGNPGNNQLNATANRTQVYGLAGNDTLTSDSKSDVLLIGGSGDDSLIMSGGNGTLSGGKGKDTFELNYSATKKLSAMIEDIESSSDKIVVNFDGTTAPILNSVVSGNDVVLSDGEYLNVTLKGVRDNDYFDGTTSDEAWEVLKLTNAEREKQNLPALTLSDGLTAGAQIRAKEITQKGVLGLLTDHTRPDDKGNYYTVFKEVGKTYSQYAENLDGGAATPQEVVDQWMSSEDHKKNILDEEHKNYSKLGVGYNYNDPDPTNHRYYWTQLFADSLINPAPETVDVSTASPQLNTVSKFIRGDDAPNTINNSDYGATIDALGGGDKITNTGLLVSIIGGADNDFINNSGSFVTINGGTGDDKISLSSNSEGNLFQYKSGNGNDIIRGFALSDTVSISGGEYTTETIGNNIIIHVGTGSVTLLDAAILSPIIPFANMLNFIDLSPIKIDGTPSKLLVLTKGDDIYFSSVEGATIAGLGGNDSIWNVLESHVLIDCGTGNDSIENYGDNVTITGGEGNDSINSNAVPGGGFLTIDGGNGNDKISIEKSCSNVSINGGEDNDSITSRGDNVTIEGSAGDDDVFNWEGVNVTVNSGTGNDTITNNGVNIIINSGDGDDDIYNTNLGTTYTDDGQLKFDANPGDGGSFVTIDSGDGNDNIGNSGSNVTIEGGNGNETISNNGNNVTISGGTGNDSIKNEGSNVTINGNNDNDYIFNTSSYVKISGNSGNDTIFNTGNNISIEGDTGNDYIFIPDNGSNITINSGLDNDIIAFNNNSKNNLIQYVSGNGRDAVWGFDETSTLKIGDGTGTYSTQVSDNDIFVNVGSGYVVLVFAASLSAVNIEGVERESLEENNYIFIDERTYNNNREGVTISPIFGGNSITNSGDNVSINGGPGDVTINSTGSNVTIDARSNSTITNSGSNAYIYSGDGDDSISNTGDNVTLLGGTDKDTIYSTGNNNNIEGGLGDDLINLSNDSKYNLIRYASGDGSDTVSGFNESDSLLISESNYASSVEGDNVIVKVGNDNITLLDAATLSININGISNEFSTEDKLIILNDKDNSYENSVEGATIAGLGGNDYIRNLITFGEDLSHPSLGSYLANVSINGGDDNDTLNNSGGEDATLEGGAGDDYISNGGINPSISGGDGKDTIENSGASATISGGADNDEISNQASNTSIGAGAGNDNIYNASLGDNVTINGGDGDDSIRNYGESVTIDVGVGNDEISNSGKSVAINMGDGDNYISNEGDNVTINGGDEADRVTNYGSNVTILSGAGNDSINNDNFFGDGTNVLINSDSGNDSITNNNSNVTINAGSGDDVITNSGANVTINVGTGNDRISLSSGASNNVINYTAGDGDDTILGYSTNTTINISGDKYDTQYSGDDIVYTVGNGKITLKDARDKPLPIIIGESGTSGGNSDSGGEGGDSSSSGSGGGRGGNDGGNTSGGTSANEGRGSDASGGKSAVGSAGRGATGTGSDSSGGGNGRGRSRNSRLNLTTPVEHVEFPNVLTPSTQPTTTQPTANQRIYSGGNQIISDYTSGEKIVFSEVYTGSFYDGAGNYCVGSSTGALVIQNAMDKVIDLSDVAGNDFVKAYAATTAGVIDGRGLAGFEIINGSAGADAIFAGDGGSQLWGGADYVQDIMVGGGGTDIFISGRTQGADIVLNASSTDIVHLNDATLSDIIATEENNGAIAIAFNTGNVIGVQSSELLSSTFMLADGSQYRYNHSTKNWQNA